MAARTTLMNAASRACRRMMDHRSINVRQYASAAAASSGTDGSSYVSPYKDFFDMMERNETSLGVSWVEEPPRYLKCGVCEDALRFKTTHYGRMLLPPHVQPGEHRVQLKVFLGDLNLSDDELEVMKQIVGSRVSDERGELRLTSDQFGSRIENKRHLVSMLDRIVICSKQLAQEALQDTTAQQTG